MSEYSVDLNAKFDNKQLEANVRSIFIGLQANDITIPDGFKKEMLELFPSHEDAIDEFLAPGEYGETISDGLLNCIENINTDKASKLCIVCLGDSNSEEYIPKFLKFISNIGGTPLMCKIYHDEHIVSYKMGKKGGITETIKERGDDY